ncbi:Spo0E like sporulation regulatory protein [Keratinibaculum paraultunense]|uniref:Spo0E like sporulation regulatory protein n=1 Tax=Keratinibaculum paraultunense TaxID=1278232 RepID=A0A4R3KUZ8_9FIRM|nr:aspartyl-phosphate phosphatase Spo0E family protein [Keratinibaculum paraultunense]QQY79833.1 Spo0E family sporulation regulatory protein-aspartic acid phosphatase [Keratinibaculum paraultunense]TCS88714.1 Spo0E like sporulation regulatory protein [Keratinibaculum paraultunense]
MRDEIDNLRIILEKEISSSNVNYNKVLEISKALDEIIVKYYDEKEKSNIKIKNSINKG